MTIAMPSGIGAILALLALIIVVILIVVGSMPLFPMGTILLLLALARLT